MAAGKKTQKSKPTTDVFSAYEQALAAMYEQDYERAKDLFREIEQQHPSEKEVIARAKTLCRLCDRRQAESASQGAAPATADEAFDRGVFFHNNGELQTALGHFEEALKRSDDNAGHIYYAMAATQTRLGHHSAALHLLDKAIEINEENRHHATHDPDFAELLDQGEFKKLVQSA